VAIILAVAPDLQPHLLDQAISRALESAGNHPSIGGDPRCVNRAFFCPPAKHSSFLAGARSVDERLEAMRLFESTIA
jgi:hypothetical protein